MTPETWENWVSDHEQGAQDAKRSRDAGLRTDRQAQFEAWIRADPEWAMKVLLETGALEHHGYLHSSGGVDSWCPGVDCEIPDCAIVPLYRLVTEENRDD